MFGIKYPDSDQRLSPNDFYQKRPDDNLASDFDESQNFSPMEKNKHNLIQNLNKGNKYLDYPDQ